MKTPFMSDDGWFHVLSVLPDDLEESAREKLAIRRCREIQSAADLLRMCLAYGVCDMSLRQAAAWATTIGLGELSNVAVLKRLQQAGEWLGHLVTQWLVQRGLTTDVPARPLRILDATCVRAPGSNPSNYYRLHVRFDLPKMRIVDVELTDPHEAEDFRRHPPHPNEILIADRGYGYAGGIGSILRQQGHVVVRIHWRCVSLQTQKGKRLDLPALLQTLEADEVGDWPILLRDKNQVYPLRLVALVNSQAATEREVKHLREAAHKHQHGVDPRSIKMAAYTYVLTDLPAQEVSAIQVLELFRFRWQVELAFKRLKSLLHIDHLLAKGSQLARTYLLSNILGALIIEELWDRAVSFFPWGFPLFATAVEPLASL